MPQACGGFSYEPRRAMALDLKLEFNLCKELFMRMDVFRRSEADGKFSHLAVPHGRVLPGEVTNYDWHDEARDVELDESVASWPQYGIEAPGRQLKEKGYAITAVAEMTDGDEA